MVKLVQATRKQESGVSPRGTLALLRAAQGYAMVEGRDYVVPEDIKAIATCVLSHRMIMESADAESKEKFVKKILDSIPLPTEDWNKRG